MNIFAIIILTTLFAQLVLNFIADFLNLKMIKNKIPVDFKDLYDEETYNKSQEYLKVTTRFDWLSSAFGTIIMLMFWFFKGFPFLDNTLRSLGYSPVVTGILFMGILILGRTIISLPFSLYSTFVIEEKFGFNKTTFKTYVVDMVKSTILSVIIGAPLLAGILSFFEYAGSYAWIYCWVTVVVVMLLLNYLVPVWIMPLFNKFEPVEDGELKDGIMSYARSINFSLDNIFKMDGSKRSSKSNAYFTGFGKHKRIVLFDTLIDNHTTPELIAVLAHEMGHFKKKHIIKTLIVGILQAGFVFFIMSVCLTLTGLFDAFYMDHKSIYAGLVFFGMLYAPVDFFTGILMQIYSRKNEYEADGFAAKTTGNPDAMINALKKLSVHNLGNLLPHPFYVFLNYSHPPVLKRIEFIKSL